MALSRRRLLQIASAAPALAPFSAPARAQAYPSRPLKIIAPWPVGGAVDALSRALGSRLEARLGQPVITENRPGAGSTLGVNAGARSAPDGYTLVLAGNSSLAISPTMYKKLSFDPLKDFAPVALIARIPMVLVVHPSMPFKSVAELVQYAKEKPGQLNYGSGGPGSSHHMVTEMFRSATGIEITHVPYGGSAPAMNDLMAGHIQMLFSDPLPAPPQIKAGTVRALGVTSAQRWDIMPEIPTIAEGGVTGFDAVNWTMAAAPAGTPKEIVDRLAAEFRAVAKMPDAKEQISKLGMVLVESDPPDELLKFIASEGERWGGAVQRAGLAGTL
ncbi:MAG TPA: tripartite tricarboxylate transporter substrate binding protein [Hyphomicrobiaceae bacterium]|nr:tripartite tricarboxylate transporter substrate binding protein [Hyphomicrobiaceae bacterium]